MGQGCTSVFSLPLWELGPLCSRNIPWWSSWALLVPTHVYEIPISSIFIHMRTGWGP